MKIFFRNVGLVIASLCVLGGLISILWKGCRFGSDHTAEASHLDSLQHTYDSSKASGLREITRLRGDSAQWASRFDSLRRQDSAVREDLLARAEVVRNTLTGGDLAASRLDTAAILINWDSLRAEVKAGLPIVILHDSLSQEQIQTCIAQGRVKDSIAEMWHTLFALTDTAYTQTRTAYKGLLKDYNRQQFQVKLWKPIAIGGIAYVMATIVMQALKK